MQEIRVSHPSTNQKMLLDFTKISSLLHTLPINSYDENGISNSYDLSSANEMIFRLSPGFLFILRNLIYT